LLNPSAGGGHARFQVASMIEAFAVRRAPIGLRKNTENLVAEL